MKTALKGGFCGLGGSGNPGPSPGSAIVSAFKLKWASSDEINDSVAPNQSSTYNYY